MVLLEESLPPMLLLHEKGVVALVDNMTMKLQATVYRHMHKHMRMLVMRQNCLRYHHD
jgi:hypothetical protein